MWPEILILKTEKKRELNLNGEKLTELLTKSDDGKLDVALFEQQQLNFLQLTHSELSEISDEIEKLENLQSLLVFGNRLSLLPSKFNEIVRIY